MLSSWQKEDRIRYVEVRLQELEIRECEDPKAPSRVDHKIWLLREKGNSWKDIADRHYPKHMKLSARKSAAVRARGRVERYYTNAMLTSDSRETLESLLSGVKVVFVHS
jgi:hypothetical protein